LFISPLSGTSYFLGIFLAHSCIGIGQVILVYTIASFLGAQIQGSILLGCAIILLSIVSYVGVGFILGTQFARRTEDVNSLVAAFGVPLLILGGAFLPTSLFPKSLLDLAQYNPIYHMNEALMGVWADGKDLADISSHFGFLCIFAVLMIGAGWLSYRRMLRVERRL
jgi:ABC-2 type transport system permease protein